MTTDIKEISKDIEHSRLSLDSCTTTEGADNEDYSTNEGKIRTDSIQLTDIIAVPSTQEFERNHCELMRTAKFEWQISKDFGEFEVKIKENQYAVENCLQYHLTNDINVDYVMIRLLVVKRIFKIFKRLLTILLKVFKGFLAKKTNF